MSLYIGGSQIRKEQEETISKKQDLIDRLKRIKDISGSRFPSALDLVLKKVEGSIEPQGDYKAVSTLPTSIPDAIAKSFDTPTLSPIGLILSPKKMIIKQGSKFIVPAIVGAGGFLLGSIFGGGGSQKQELSQDAEMDTDVDATQDTDVRVNPIQELLNKIFLAQSQKQEVDSDAAFKDVDTGGGDIFNASPIEYAYEYSYSTIYSPQTTVTNTYPTQITTTISGIKQDQDAEQKGGIGLFEIAIIGGAILGASYFLGRKKK